MGAKNHENAASYSVLFYALSLVINSTFAAKYLEATINYILL